MSTDIRRASELRVPNDYAREYLKRNEGITITSSTVESYDCILTEFVTFLNQYEKSVLSAEFSDVLDYIDACVRQGNRKSTISGKLSTVGELYRYIRLRTDAKDELSLDPIRFREVDLNRYNTPEAIEREALSREEIRRLFDAFNSYRNRLIAVVGVETGLRNSDLRNLLMDNINENVIHVHDPKNSKPYDVPITEDLSFEIEFWIQHHRKGFAASNESDYVFPSQHGAKLDTNTSLNSIVKQAAERAGIQETIGRSRLTPSQKEAWSTDKEYRTWHRVTVHTLRHSYITLLKEAGVSLSYRQLVANHVSADTTQGYTHGKNEVFDTVRNQFDPPR